MYGVRNSTRPMSRNASRSRTSMDSSFLPVGAGWIGLLGESAMVRKLSSGPDQNRPHETDDSETRAACPSRRRGARHTCPPLRACIPSRWDGNGKPREARAKGTVYRNPMWRLPLSALRHQPIHFASKLLHGRLQSSTPRVDHYVPLRWNVV